MIDLYGMTSPNVRKIFFMLEECGLPYRFHHVRVLHCDQFKEDFLKLNPNAKVPVIVDHDGPDGKPYTVFESGAILIYLAEKTGKFLPAAGVAKYDTLQWLMIQMANVGPLLGQLNHFSMFAPPDIDRYALKRYQTEARRLYDLLDARVAQFPYLAASEYTIADIATYPWALYHENHGLDWSEHPNLKAWCDKIGARPAIQRGIEAIKQIEPIDGQTMMNAPPEALDRFFNRGWMREQ